MLARKLLIPLSIYKLINNANINTRKFESVGLYGSFITTDCSDWEVAGSSFTRGGGDTFDTFFNSIFNHSDTKRHKKSSYLKTCFSTMRVTHCMENGKV